MKLSNLASLDPVQKARGVRGLPGASEQDRRMWKEFHVDLDVLGPESEQLLHDLFTSDDEREVDFLDQDKIRLERSLKPPTGSTDATAWIRVRRGQQFFRQTILSSYGVRCCISEINVPSLLVASHIKPWRDFPKERLNPQNGVCLSTLHDAAFDVGLITINETFTVLVSPKLKRYLPSTALEHNFSRFEGTQIRMPEKVAEPNPAFLRYHHKNIFQK
ncbi:MAG: HNH endonuclease [Pyrinomonadaceae bacterium]